MYGKYFLSCKHRKEKPHIIILVTLETKNSGQNVSPTPLIITQFVTYECHLQIHTYNFINPGSCMTIRDAKTVSDETEKGAKKN